jgi:hypothetical protein
MCVKIQMFPLNERLYSTGLTKGMPQAIYLPIES